MAGLDPAIHDLLFDRKKATKQSSAKPQAGLLRWRSQ
jgi:hypothetical protein